MTARYVDCARTHLAIKKESDPGRLERREKKYGVITLNEKY